MSFWDIPQEDLDAVKKGNFESGGGAIEPIPANTQLQVAIEEASNKEWQGDAYIEIKWTVMQPEQYKNRKVFQKLKIFDADKAKKHKAMLAAIDANAGGNLMKINGAPDDMQLQQHLAFKSMYIVVGVWELDDKSKSGNWVQSVSAVKKGGATPQAQAAVSPTYDDEIGF